MRAEATGVRSGRADGGQSSGSATRPPRACGGHVLVTHGQFPGKKLPNVKEIRLISWIGHLLLGLQRGKTCFPWHSLWSWRTSSAVADDVIHTASIQAKCCQKSKKSDSFPGLVTCFLDFKEVRHVFPWTLNCGRHLPVVNLKQHNKWTLFTETGRSNQKQKCIKCHLKNQIYPKIYYKMSYENISM